MEWEADSEADVDMDVVHVASYETCNLCDSFVGKDHALFLSINFWYNYKVYEFLR